MAKVKFYRGTEDALSTHQQENGAIYITTDTKKIYADIDGNRLKLGGSSDGGSGGKEYSFQMPLTVNTSDEVSLVTGSGLFLTDGGALAVSPTPLVTTTTDGLMASSDKVKLDKQDPGIICEMTTSQGIVVKAMKNAILFSAPTLTAQQFTSLNTIEETVTGSYVCTQEEADNFLLGNFYSTFGDVSGHEGPWYHSAIYVYTSELGYASVRPQCTYDGTQLNFNILIYIKGTRSPANAVRSMHVAFKV